MDEPRVKYTIKSTVVGVAEHTLRKWKSDVGDEAVFTEEPTGWFVLLAGSHEALFLGMERPDLKIGDGVSITIQKE